ncbi:cytochrome P450 [Aspergillus minisclerotigenes]|uniref:Cytochrome P450 n=1 Tax=Aspergillus minisclerotigenes TaxID=656917 RepID=A0A5N6JEC1_9EURO|nr:cytochrome P450 [Aspergillus minisclerotigenes]
MDSIFLEAFDTAVLYAPTVGIIAALSLIASFLIIFVSDLLYCGSKTAAVQWAPCIPGKSLLSERYRPSKSMDQYQEDKNGKAFSISDSTGTGYMVLLPPEHYRDWYNVPRDHVNWGKAVNQEFSLDDLGIDLGWHIAPLTVQRCSQVDFIKRVEGSIIRELDRLLVENLTGSKEWHLCHLLNTVVNIYSHIALLVVLGPEFSHNTALAKQLPLFNMQLSDRMGSEKSYPVFLKPLVRKFSTKTRHVQSIMAEMKRTIVPEIRRRVEQSRRRTIQRSQDCFLDVMIELALKKSLLSHGAEKDDERHFDMMAIQTIFLLFEVLGGLTPVTTSLLYQIMKAPEYLIPLREELAAALKQTDNAWSFDIFKHTPKFESFTKECFRVFTPAGIISAVAGGGLVEKPLQLASTGRTLSPGTKFSLPAQQAHLDPDNYHSPNVFDGYRFCDPQSGACDIRGTITPSAKWLVFGIGTSACPARLLATRISQSLFAKVLRDYDLRLKLEDGQPEVIYSGANMFVNFNTQMHVKSASI